MPGLPRSVSKAHGARRPSSNCKQDNRVERGLCGTTPARIVSAAAPLGNSHSRGPLPMNIAALRTFARQPLLALGLLAASVGPLAAQGIVSGRLTDVANGGALEGARIALLSTSLTATTTNDGRLRVHGGPPRTQ